MPEPSTVALWIVLALLVIFTGVAISRAIRIVPQATAVIVQRLGRYHRTLDAGLHFLIPFIDKVRATVDLREQVVSFPPQPVITSDNLVVSIDTVIYFQPTDPKAAVYEIANYIQGNVIGSLDLEQTLTSRDQINGQLRGVLDDATGRWGIRVNRVELKAIDPPASVQDSMEKQMRAERDRRAAILNAEGVKQSQILTAEGEKQAQILRAEGTAQAAILEAQGEAKAILRVFDAIHTGNPDSKLLAYQYLQMLPQIAQGESNKMWIVPTELTQALQGIGAALGPHGPSGTGSLDGPPVGTASGFDHAEEVEVDEPSLEDPAEALARARREAAGAAKEAEESTRVARRGSLGGSRGEAGAGAGGPGAGPMETGPAPTPEPEMPDEPTE